MNEDPQISSPELAPENHEVDHNHFPHLVPFIVVAVIVFAAVIGGMAKVESTQTDISKVQVSPQVAGQSTEVNDFSVEQEITIEAGNFYFSPNEIHVKSGTHVKLVFKNVNGSHDFSLEEFGVKTAMMAPGEMTTVEFVADKVGHFEYYCSVGKHRQMGMKGTLVVD